MLRVIEKAFERLKIYGPDRVVIDDSGHAMHPVHARREYGLTPDVVFIRNDGWMLGTPKQFESIARELWKGTWVAQVRLQEKTWVLSREEEDEWQKRD